MVRRRTSVDPAADAAATIDLDAILDELDERWQYRTYSWSLLSAVLLLASVPLLSYMFTAGQLNHRCRVPHCDAADDSMTPADFRPSWLTNAVPRISDDPTVFSPCERFAYVGDGGSCANRSVFDQSLVERCSSIVYETAERTIGREFNITCTDDADIRLALIGTLNYAASCLLLPLCAAASDRFGRRPILLANLALSGVAGLAKSYATSYTAFAVLEFATAAVSAGTFMTVLVLGIESSAPTQRVRVGTLLSAVFSGSQVVCGLLAAWQTDFRHLLRWLFAPNLLLLTFVWLVPESVRWLLVQNRRSDVRRVLRRAAEWNGRPLCGRAWTELTESTATTDDACLPLKRDAFEGIQTSSVDSEDDTSPFMAALRSGRLRLRLLNCLLAWFAASFVYYGMNVHSVAALGGSKYVNFAAVNLVELPAILAANRLMQRAGRRRVLAAALCSGSATLLATHFTVNGGSSSAAGDAAAAAMAAGLRLVLFVAGKGAVTLALTVLYVYTAEMFPTRTRQTFMNACSTSGAIGAMLAPMSTLLAAVWSPLPMVAFGGAALIAGIAALGLPETLGRRLPDTVHEAERLAERTEREL